MKTKIAHLISLHNTGGVECNFSELINSPPPELELEHAVYTPKLEIANQLHDQVMTKIRTHASYCHLGNKKIPNWPKSLRKWRKQWLVKNYDPEITIFWNKLTDINPQLFKLRCKTVYYEHSRAWMNHHFDEEKRTLLSVDQIICCSNASKRLLELKYGLPPSTNISVCLNAVRPSCVPVSIEPRSLTEENTIGFAGRLTGIKGCVSLIHAIKDVLNLGYHIKLLIAGDGPDKEAISSLISRMGLNKHIQLLGNVHNMSRFYHSIDLLITPSIKEPFGLTIAEAMAHGIPVICTEVDGTTEVFVNGTSGLAIKPTLTATEYQALGGNLKGWPEYIYSPTEDTIVEAKALAPDLLAKEISMLLNNKHRYSAMSLQARDHAVNQLNYQKHVEKLYRLLLA